MTLILFAFLFLAVMEFFTRYISYIPRDPALALLAGVLLVGVIGAGMEVYNFIQGVIDVRSKN